MILETAVEAAAAMSIGARKRAFLAALTSSNV